MERTKAAAVCEDLTQVEQVEVQISELSDCQLALAAGGVGEMTPY